MDAANDSPLIGHLEIKKTYDKLRMNYYWPNIHAVIRVTIARELFPK